MTNEVGFHAFAKSHLEYLNACRSFDEFSYEEKVQRGEKVWTALRTTDKEFWSRTENFLPKPKKSEPFDNYPSPDDEDFWGSPSTNENWLDRMMYRNQRGLERLSKLGLFDLDPDTGEPLSPMIVFSKTKLVEENKTLMAHIMVDLKLFPSVGQARKNGWDKPIEVGGYSVTKKKIRFRIID